MVENPVVSDVLKFGRASGACDSSQRTHFFRTVQEYKSFLQGELDNVIEDHPNAPVLLQFSTDCTLVKVRHYYSHESITGKQRSSTAAGKEFVVMPLFATVAIGTDSTLERLVYPEPLELKYGKNMPAILACCQQFLSSVGSYASPESITVMHQMHDRGLTKTFWQAVAFHHESMALSIGTSSSLVSSRHPAQLIYLDAGCSLHDSHNALKWVWQTLKKMAYEEVLKNLHIALAPRFPWPLNASMLGYLRMQCQFPLRNASLPSPSVCITTLWARNPRYCICCVKRCVCGGTVKTRNSRSSRHTCRARVPWKILMLCYRVCGNFPNFAFPGG